jgi:glucose-1-phosphate cytidylyltransferase
MKAVLLAGGFGTRMREETEFRPKPMVEIGGKPVLWHIMKLLAAQGITDFIICSGYKSEYITSYFANYGAEKLEFSFGSEQPTGVTDRGSHDEVDWNISVIDTGLDTMTGGRIKRIQEFIGNERFFCTYGDGIADVNIKRLIEHHESRGKLATLTTTQLRSRFGVVETDENGVVTAFREKPIVNDLVNIGYFIFEPGVFDYLSDDTTVLEEGPMRELAQAGEIAAFLHSGFWQPMDTQREYQELNEIWQSGEAPWKIW